MPKHHLRLEFQQGDTQQRAIGFVGFRPFGGSKHNMSEMVAHALSREVAGSECLNSLPVSYRHAVPSLADRVRAAKIRVLVMLGEHPDVPAGKVHVEMVAKPTCGPSKDEDGRSCPDTPFSPKDPILAPQTFGISPRLLATRFRDTVVWSDSAGDFLCNHVAYCAYCREPKSLPARALFVHVPKATAGPEEPKTKTIIARTVQIIKDLVAEAKP
jgi:pyrrolidone-carboxylate peptidase